MPNRVAATSLLFSLLFLMSCGAEEEPPANNGETIASSNNGGNLPAATLVDPCDVVTEQQMADLLGVPFVIERQGGASDSRKGCVVRSDGGLNFEIQIDVYRTNEDFSAVLEAFRELYPGSERTLSWTDEGELRTLQQTIEFSTITDGVALVGKSVDTGGINGLTYVQANGSASSNPDDGREALDLATLSDALDGFGGITSDGLYTVNGQ